MTSSQLVAGESISNKPKNGGYAWLVMIVCLIAMIAQVMLDSIMTPTMADMCDAFGEDTVWGGTMSSMMGIITAIIILPTGAVLTKVSARWTAVFSLVLIAVGCLFAGFVETATMFVIARGIQGIGYGIMVAVGMTIVTRWFDEEHRGLPMGIFDANVGFGGFLINFVATPITETWNWQALYIFTAIWTVLAIVLMILFVKDWPSEGKLAEEIGHEGKVKKAKFTDTFKTPSIWLMCLTFLFMGIALQGMGAFMAMILMDLGQLSPEGANLINSFISIGVVLCTIIGGAIYTVVTRKAKSKRGLLLFILVIVGAASVYCILTCVNNTATCWIFSMFFALCSTMYLPGMYILSAEHAGTPALASMGLTIFMFGQFLGGIIGPILIGWVNASFGGFAAAGPFVAILGCLAIACTAGVWFYDKKILKKQTGEEQKEIAA